MVFYDGRTILEQMAQQKPLPDEPYPMMHKDGYSMYDITETAARSIMRHKFAEMEERDAAQDFMNVHFSVEEKVK